MAKVNNLSDYEYRANIVVKSQRTLVFRPNIILVLHSDVDLYKLYRVVDQLGGHTRVTNKNLWKQVARKLGFENTWSINQVCKN